MNAHVLENIALSVLKQATSNLNDVGKDVDYRQIGINLWDDTIEAGNYQYFTKIVRYYLIRERVARRYKALCLGFNIYEPIIDRFIRKDLKVIESYEQYVLDNGHTPPKFEIGDKVSYYNYSRNRACFGKVESMVACRAGNKFYRVAGANGEVSEINMSHTY